MNDFALTAFALGVIVVFAAFQQTITGFGFSLIVMPLASFVLGLRVAAPLIALASLMLYTINLVRYRDAVNFAEVKPLALAAIFGVPVGVWLLANVNESLIKTILGLILIAYALYNLARPLESRLQSRGWGLLAGFVSGCLGGAYNTPGPALIIYGTLRHWRKDEFRAILQLLFFISATLTVASHWIAQNITLNVLVLYLVAAPALAVGSVLAARVDARINKDAFRKIVIWMILVLGLSLVIR
jgi:uncharacterized membrane protein YfcA